MIKYFSAFTGVGGFDMGVPSDWECIGMSEINKHANMILRYRFKDVKNYGDIEKINYEELPDFDVLIGGSPCQNVSVSGKREGLNGLQSRLFFSYVSLLKSKQPRYFIFENVRGLLSSNSGWDFAEVINQFSEAGYDIWWQVLNASDFGIPQHRERVFVFGTLRRAESDSRKIFFEGKSKGKNTGIQRQETNTITRRYKQAQGAGTYVAQSKLNTQIENLHPDKHQINRIYGINGIAPTLHRKTGGGQITKIGLSEEESDTSDLTKMDIRYLTPLECERLMGWEDNWTKYGIDEKGRVVELSDNVRYSLIGNGIVPQIVENIIREIMVI